MMYGFEAHDMVFFDHVTVALGDDKPQRRCIKGNLRWKKDSGFILTGVESNSSGVPKFFKAPLASVDVFPKSASLYHGRGIQEMDGRFYCDVCLQFQGALKISEKFAERLAIKKFDLSKYGFEIVSGGVLK